ncbi:hypothetical protein HF650_00995 [Kosakonia sp. SMBL-WEM22]|uniref:hypothetical protein n=1 Tax=Kosakonia sp. SMBL-WEM22 TaxID=2725560 RepID=UPI00165989EB|nr:hypothetical protein [Kosakonia sp. SMBL-WEM22]QNQ18457.1 hypothetical protein HF650_00995 [Kosakonia sp. SMBL-WEM22]
MARKRLSGLRGTAYEIAGFAGWRVNAYPAYGIDGFAGSRRPDKAKPPSGNGADAESKKPNLAVGFF